MVVSKYCYCSEIIRDIGTHANMRTSSPAQPSLTCTTFQLRKPLHSFQTQGDDILQEFCYSLHAPRTEHSPRYRKNEQQSAAEHRVSPLLSAPCLMTWHIPLCGLPWCTSCSLMDIQLCCLFSPSLSCCCLSLSGSLFLSP